MRWTPQVFGVGGLLAATVVVALVRPLTDASTVEAVLVPYGLYAAVFAAGRSFRAGALSGLGLPILALVGLGALYGAPGDGFLILGGLVAIPCGLIGVAARRLGKPHQPRPPKPAMTRQLEPVQIIVPGRTANLDAGDIARHFGF